MRALLISNSGRPFLEHCRDAIAEFLGPARRVGFVTAASLNNEKDYCERARVALEAIRARVRAGMPYVGVSAGEYHVVNANPVLGIEEGAWLRVEGGVTTAGGRARVKVFTRNTDPVWYRAGDHLLGG
jgi:hypothetical protein